MTHTYFDLYHKLFEVQFDSETGFRVVLGLAVNSDDSIYIEQLAVLAKGGREVQLEDLRYEQQRAVLNEAAGESQAHIKFYKQELLQLEQQRREAFRREYRNK